MKLYVIQNNMFIGTLAETDNGFFSFEYLNNITPNQFLIGINEKSNFANSLFPIFENLLPEHEQLNILKTKYNITHQIGALLYLDNIHGSFEFYKNIEDIPNNNKTIIIYSDVKHSILDNNYTFPNILNDYALDIPDEQLYSSKLLGSKITGLSGYQYKFGVHKDNIHKRIYLQDDNRSNYILKPENTHYSEFKPKDHNNVYIPFLLINEHLFMTLARDMGFDVPYNGIIKHKDYYHYIIKRYDRYNDFKIDHYESLVLLEKSSVEKYSIPCKDILIKCKEYITKDELTKVFKFIVFSIIIGHGDLHAKNISLICSSNDEYDRKMEFAPLYDISTSSIYYDVDDNDVGLKINGKNKEITLNDLIWLANVVDISEEIALTIITDVSTKFIQTFISYIDKLPQDIKELPFHGKKSLYASRKSLYDTFIKYHKKRCEYIKTHLLIEQKNPSIWD